MTEQLNFSDLWLFEQMLGILKDESTTRFKLNINEEELINEGVFKSYSALDLTNIFVNNYGFGTGKNFIENGYNCGIWGFRYQDNNKKFLDEIIVLVACLPKDYEKFENIKKIMKNGGWTLTSINVSKLSDEHLEYTFEKNRQVEEIEVPSFLYHLTPQNKLNKILTNGLTPHSGNKKTEHPERIYFLSVALSENVIKGFADSLWKANMLKKMKDCGLNNAEKVVNNFKRDIEYCLLKVETEKCKGLRLYGDPNLPIYAVWTYDNIPSQAITVIEKNI